MIAVSYVLASLTAAPPWALVGAWLVSGALTFWPPVESLLARLVFGLHHPTAEELARLRPLWREVTARAGIDRSGYTLWVEESPEVNATATSGHIVGITSFALQGLPDGQLAAVLAHELGHHAGGHAWAGLMASWYSLPGRLAWRLFRMVILAIGGRSAFAATLLVLVLGAGAMVAMILTHGLVLLPGGVPFLIAAVGRNSELRADRYASTIGLAPQLTALLKSTTGRSEPATPGPRGLLARLLTSHPDNRARLHALQRHALRRP